MNLYKSISKKKTIVDVIVNLMDEEGLKNVTIKDICENADISIGSFYHYFSSKDSIVQEMYQLMDEYFLLNKDNICSHFTAIEDIIDFVTHFGLYVEQWGYYANLLVIRTSLEEAAKGSLNQHKKIYNVLKDIIDIGIEDKFFKISIDDEDLASTIFVIIRGYMLEWTKRGANYPVKDNMVRQVKYLLNSIS
ncbi:Bacterial regulatory protein, tetR family [anaerobic digester metagenome]|uniref:TetR family transcriptional regulator n=1 Tax=Sedimentibacter saalensis TaxID=130788 RepID=A0A562JK40_9FIRM|nr:TetR/AcrR family transcriptional regulator [Sedimentibacter saalensis]TWH83566.1 TetR family transcriptional regulator [Sedimentibacter saalensis]